MCDIYQDFNYLSSENYMKVLPSLENYTTNHST